MVTREVIPEKMPPILDSIIFFGVLTPFRPQCDQTHKYTNTQIHKHILKVAGAKELQGAGVPRAACGRTQ